MREFKFFINESLDIPGINETGLGEFILESMFLADQFHLYHLLTTNAQEHTAIGKFYSKLDEETDSIAEKFIALGGIYDTPYTYTIDPSYSLEIAVSKLEMYRERVNEMIDKTNSTNFKAINNELIELQELIDETIYQLDLE